MEHKPLFKQGPRQFWNDSLVRRYRWIGNLCENFHQ